jgi:short-subunit dehydrogenase
MAKIARQRRRVEAQYDKVDMEYTHDVALYNVDLKDETSFQQRAYDSPKSQ